MWKNIKHDRIGKIGVSRSPAQVRSAAQLGGAAGEAAGSLDIEKGGALTENLRDLYVYIALCLVHANPNSDSAAVGEVLGLLGGIRALWPPLVRK